MQYLQALWAKLQQILPSKRLRLVVVGVIGLAAGVVLYLAVSGPPEKKPVQKTPQQRQVFMPQNLDKKVGLSGVSTEMATIKKQNAELQKKLEEMQEAIKKMQTAVPDARTIKAEVEKNLREELKKQTPPPATKEVKPEEDAKTASPPEQPHAKAAKAKDKGNEWWKDLQQPAKTPPPATKEVKPAKPGEPVKPDTHKPGDIRVVTAKDSPKGEGVAAVKDKNKKDEDKGTFLPAGSIFSGTLLTGMDVPTGTQGRRDPFPVLLRVKKEAILPNRYRTDVRECFLVASGWGDLSSERAYVRAERLSCIRADGKALESNLQMYAVGEDGKAGIRGRVVNKTGALLGRALVAGFLEGFSKLFGKQPMVSIYTPSSVGRNAKAPFESYLSADALQSAGLAGAGSAMDRLAKYYIDMAENIYPVIEIDAGRAIDFILLSGVHLKLQQGQVTVGE